MDKRLVKSLIGLIVGGIAEIARRASKKKEKELSTQEKVPRSEASEEGPRIHPWRLCPIGSHWVRTHALSVGASAIRPGGRTVRHGHCAHNPRRGKRKNSKIARDYIAPLEMNEIAKSQFGLLSGPPAKSPKNEDWNFPNADKYDDLIRGWTKYWNEVLKPNEPLDPDLVKALIASESGFNPKPPDQNTAKSGLARGLIQLTDQTIKALGDLQGELNDHYVEISENDAYDPNLSIAAGIRWLFRKKDWASGYIRREASWDETIAAYKGYLPGMVSGKNPNPSGMKTIRERYQELKK
jgi:hypothetical protein